MSQSIDQKVVEMKFDNRQFESNVSNTMSTLDKLKRKLNFSGASKGLSDVQAASERCNMSPLSNAVETVHAKFSALQIMGVTALANITNSAINAGKNLIKSLTIDPIMTGFQEYETQINAVQTILANTASKGTNLEQVNDALDTLNTYADKTIYNFTEMTRNIGTFTAAGVDLDTSVSAIQGIANLAAISGSNSQQASTAMYQLSQAMATGTVRLMDWNSVVNAGMGGQVFQDALKETSRELNTGADAAIAANGSFRESLQTGWLTTQVLTETLKKFTTSGANEYVAEYCGISADAVQAALDTATAQYGEADAIDKASEALAEKTGRSKDEIKAVLDMAKTAEDAATKVKTFTQLLDTLKEAAQSGWTQSWEIIVGDFEEAKALFTEISDTIGGIIGESAESRNELLQSWKDLGGRTAIIDGIRNAFQGIIAIVEKISEAFREVFPPITAQQLLKVSEGFRDLMSNLKLSDDGLEKVKSTFKGLFSVIHIVAKAFTTVIKVIASLFGVAGSLGDVFLTVTGTLGDWISKIDEAITKSGIFETASEGISSVLHKIADAIKNFFSGMNGVDLSGFSLFDVLRERLQGVWDFIQKIGGGIGKALGKMFDSISEGLSTGNFDKLLDFLNTLALGGIGIGLKKFVDSIHTVTEEIEKLGGLKQIVGGINDVLNGVKDTLKAYQDQLKSKTLLNIALAIGILAASLLVLSLIDSDKLTASLAAMGALMGGLMLAMTMFTKIGDLTGVIKSVGFMIGIAAAVFILAIALKKISDIKPDQMLTGILGIASMMLIMVGAVKAMTVNKKAEMEILKCAGQMLIMSAAILILAQACKSLSGLSWEELAKGVLGIAGILATLVGAIKILDGQEAAITKFAGQMILMSVAIGALALVAKMLGSMSWEELAKGGAGLLGIVIILVAAAKIMSGEEAAITKFAGQMLIMSAAIAIIVGALKVISGLSWEELGKGVVGLVACMTTLVVGLNALKFSSSGSAQLLVAATSLLLLAGVLKILGSMSLEELAKGIITLGISMAILVVGLNAMSGTVAGSAALLVASVALVVFASALKTIGSMSVESIAKGLVTIAVAFGILFVAGIALSGLTPVLLAVSAAMIIFGIGVLAVGVGLIAIGAGIGAIAVAVAGGATAIAAGLTVIITSVANLIPLVIQKIGEGIVAFCQVIAESAPAIGEAVKAVVLTLLDVLVECIPQLVEGLFTLLIQVLNTLTEKMPELVESLVNFLKTLFENVAARIGELVQPVADLLKSVFQAAIEVLSSVIQELIVPILNVLKDLIVGIVEAIAPYMPQICDAIVQVAQIISDAIVKITEILAPFIPDIKEIVQAVTEAVQAICDAFTSLVEQIAPVIDSISGLIQQLGDSISQILQSVADVITSCGDTISQIFQSIADVISTCGDTISQVLSELADTIDSVFNGISEVITSVGDSIESVLDGIAEVIDSIGEAALNAGTGFDNLANGVKTITELNIGDMSLSMAAVAVALGDIASHSSGLAEAGTGMQQIASGTQMSIMAFAVMAVGITTLTTQLTAIGPAASSSMSTLVSSVTSSSSCFNTMSTIASSAVAQVISSLSSIGSAASTFGGSISVMTGAMSSVMGSLVSIVSSTQGRVVAAITAMMNSSVSAITSRSGVFQAAGARLMTSLQAGIRVGISPIIPLLSSFLASALSMLMGRSGSFMSVGLMLMNMFTNGIRAGGSGAHYAVSSIMSSCVSALSGYYGYFYSAGASVAEGFASGISDNSYKSAAKASAMARQAAEAAKSELDINSPSKVFRKIAYCIPEGFAQGIDRRSYLAENSAKSMADNVVGSTSDALSKMSDSMNSIDNVQPKIAPVIDMSNINGEKFDIGANVSSLLTQPVDSMSVLINNAQAEINASNKLVIDAVTGLRDDLTDLFNGDDKEIAMYVDSKKLASTLVKPMNQQLSMLSRRGV